MSKGRVVRVWSDDSAKSSVLRAFYVAIEHADTAINAVLAAYPEYEAMFVEAHEGLSGTAVSFLDLAPGEVRDRVTEDQINSLANDDASTPPGTLPKA